MRKNKKLIENVNSIIAALIAWLIGTTIVLGLAWVVVWLVKSIMGL